MKAFKAFDRFLEPVADGSIDAEASDALRAQATDPSKTRKAPKPKLKPVSEAAVAAVGETLRELAPPLRCRLWHPPRG
jgi:hypothetical protein